MLQALHRFLFSLEDDLYRLFVADSKAHYRIAFVAVLIVVVAATTLMLAGGVAFQRPNCGDALLLLDTAWRYECGYKPHVEFFDSLGLTLLSPILLGMLIGGRNCNALAYGPAVLLPVLGLVACALQGGVFRPLRQAGSRPCSAACWSDHFPWAVTTNGEKWPIRCVTIASSGRC